MRVSGLMYLFEQLHCALWLLLALGLAAGQVRPEPLRLLCTALFLDGLTLACALLPFPLMGNRVCTKRGAKSRAGLMA